MMLLDSGAVLGPGSANAGSGSSLAVAPACKQWAVDPGTDRPHSWFSLTHSHSWPQIGSCAGRPFQGIDVTPAYTRFVIPMMADRQPQESPDGHWLDGASAHTAGDQRAYGELHAADTVARCGSC
ncbi:predicted protein [Plenodomus lingam JN3]|uniref:Predicted protein n=1 Tax=Leptosphaeria maculans (strain JN3 / isolate v23.1.3 / race Av1-4-5-6-7-8) TaxID=985895 RepID=E4ZJV8_LEPMJ|nr:predicted protein [Plenodomus lingam JN3]CBX91393.1 predicted protein [Plenodomus lingam JN3]